MGAAPVGPHAPSLRLKTAAGGPSGWWGVRAVEVAARRGEDRWHAGVQRAQPCTPPRAQHAGAHSQAVPQLLSVTQCPQGPEALLQGGHCREKGTVSGAAAPPPSSAQTQGACWHTAGAGRGPICVVVPLPGPQGWHSMAPHSVSHTGPKGSWVEAPQALPPTLGGLCSSPSVSPAPGQHSHCPNQPQGSGADTHPHPRGPVDAPRPHVPGLQELAWWTATLSPGPRLSDQGATSPASLRKALTCSFPRGAEPRGWSQRKSLQQEQQELHCGGAARDTLTCRPSCPETPEPGPQGSLARVGGRPRAPPAPMSNPPRPARSMAPGSHIRIGLRLTTGVDVEDVS